MRPIKCLWILMFLITSDTTYSEEIYRDAVHFKDGTVVRGFIAEQVPDGALKMKTAGGLVEYQMGDVENIKKETIEVESEKSPVLSGIASLIPGLGQHINGDHAKGFIIEGACVGGWLLTLTNKNGSPGAGEAGAAIYAAAVLYGLIDAPISASDKNAQRKKAMYAAMPDLNDLKIGLRMVLLTQQVGVMTPGVMVSLGF